MNPTLTDPASKKAEKRKKAMMRREIEWIRSNAKGGQAKGKARENRYNQMLEDDAAATAAQRVEGGAIVIPPAPRLGGNLLECREVGHCFDKVSQSVQFSHCFFVTFHTVFSSLLMMAVLITVLY